MAMGKKGSLILQGLGAGGAYGGITAALVASFSGDNLPGIKSNQLPPPTVQAPIVNLPVPQTPQPNYNILLIGVALLGVILLLK